MKVDHEELLEEYFPEALTSLKEIIKIKSFAQPPAPDAPYGKPVKEVLDFALNLAHKLGFSTHKDAQNRYGFFEYGDGKKLFVILCHLDVVPPGNLDKWVTDPFEPIEKDGKLIGRGSFDDKGPTIMNMYALKYLKDHNFFPDYKIRLVFGLTEETTWQSIESYVHDFGVADLGYTPDGEFPVVYAEKSIVDLDYEAHRDLNFEIHGGAAYNVVNDLVTYKGPFIDEAVKVLDENNISSQVDGDQLTVYGKAGHGSLPYLGVNAATWLGYALNQAGMDDPIIKFLSELHLNFDGTNFLPDLTDETGPLTQNLGVIEVGPKDQMIGINYRVPVKSDVNQALIEPMTKVAQGFGLTLKVKKTDPSVYFAKDSSLVTKMLEAYKKITHDETAEPIAIGGGTYAKAMPNVVAFGAEFDLTNSTMHAYNESVPVVDLQKMLLIYTEALVLLTKF